MANEQNLRPSEHVFTQEEHVKGGIASGKARRERRKMIDDLKYALEQDNGKGKTFQELIQAGLILNAIDSKKGGNPKAYALIAKMLGELEEKKTDTPETPTIELKIVNNENLESELFNDEDN